MPGPSGSKGKRGWGQSTINGNWRRGTGILNNELYIGRLVWNRLTYVKNLDTGKRISRLNPESEWIIDDALWDKVKARQRGQWRQLGFHAHQRPRKLLSHLLRCGSCGGGFSKVSAAHYGCSNAGNKGNFGNRLTERQDRLEGLALSALQSRLMDAALCEEFCAEYALQLNALRKERNTALYAVKRELETLERDRAKLVKAITDGVPGAELAEDFKRISARRTALEA